MDDSVESLYWQEIVVLLLWKLVKKDTVTITVEDVKACEEAFAPGMPGIKISNWGKAMDFSLVDENTGAAIQEVAQQMRMLHSVTKMND